MTLQDLENMVILELGLPYANPGGPVNWATAGPLSQTMFDYAINRGYVETCKDLGELELLTNTLVIPTQQSVWSYPIQSNATKTAIGSYATATVTFGGTVTAGAVASVFINGVPFTYTATAQDTLPSVVQTITNAINASALVLPSGTVLSPVTPALNAPQSVLSLMAGAPGVSGTTLSASGTLSLTVTASSATLVGGTAANQPIRLVRRVWYQPLGQLYRQELEPGARLISWEQLNRKTGAGYMQPFSYATQPDYCAVDPTRQQLAIYPGPFTVGDQITIEYCPIITTNAAIPASNWGYLANATDQPMLPEDCQWPIVEYATSLLYPRLREVGGGKLYRDMYRASIEEIKAQYVRDSAGDSLVFVPVEDVLATSGWDGWANA